MLPDYQLLDAAKHNDLQSAREAVNRGANVHVRHLDGVSALHLACTQGHMQMAEFLVDLGADVDETFGKRKRTLLHWAAEQSSTGVATFLLSHKANVNAQQSDGSTPLLLAAKHGHHYLVKLLLKHDALLSPRNANQTTAQSAAKRAGYHDIASLIETAAATRPSHMQTAEEEFHHRPGERSLF